MRLFGTKRIRALYIAAHTIAAPAPAMAQQKTATGKLGLRPVNNAPAEIDFEHFHRSSPDRTRADQDRPLPTKMLMPAILSQVEESADLP